MVRLKFSIDLNYEIDAPGCDFIFSIQAAKPGIRLWSPSLTATDRVWEFRE